jgi:hypothetical protein
VRYQLRHAGGPGTVQSDIRDDSRTSRLTA